MAVPSPSVHLNGTDGRELLEQHKAARRAITAAMTAMRASYPNARDYPSPGTYAPAAAQWDAWLTELVNLSKGLDDILRDIADQVHRP